MEDRDLLVALDYLLTHHRDALTKWAWGAGTTYHRLKGIQEEFEKDGKLTDENRNYIQMVFGSKHGHGTGCKIEEWSELEKFRKIYQKRQEAKKLLSCLEGKKIPVRFKHVDKYGNAIGWIDIRGIDQTLPKDIGIRVFVMAKKDQPADFKTGFIYETTCVGATSGGAIKVKLI